MYVYLLWSITTNRHKLIWCGWWTITHGTRRDLINIIRFMAFQLNWFFFGLWNVLLQRGSVYLCESVSEPPNPRLYACRSISNEWWWWCGGAWGVGAEGAWGYKPIKYCTSFVTQYKNIPPSWSAWPSFNPVTGGGLRCWEHQQIQSRREFHKAKIILGIS